MKTNPPQKMMIFGAPGSGKTTLAKKIYQANSYDFLIHMDKLMWDKGWRLRPHESFLNDLKKATHGPSWIVEGASLKGVAYCYGRCDAVIFLSVPKYKCLFRIIKRVLLSKHQPSDKPEGCREKMDWKLIQYLWGYSTKATSLIGELRISYPKASFKIINDVHDLNKWVDQ